jgi:hypothetical protein
MSPKVIATIMMTRNFMSEIEGLGSTVDEIRPKCKTGGFYPIGRPFWGQIIDDVYPTCNEIQTTKLDITKDWEAFNVPSL